MIGIKIESGMVTITSLALEPCATQSRYGKALLDGKLRACKDKYGAKLYRTISFGNPMARRMK